MSKADLNNRLSALAADIRAAHSAIRRTTLEAAERTVAAGHMLIEAKGALSHGAWDDWLTVHTGLSARTARRYMQIARSGLETATVADLGIRGAGERVSRSSPRTTPDLDSNPEYVAWRDEMNAALEALPSQAVRDYALQVMRNQVNAERLAAFLNDRMASGDLEKVCRWVERADPKQVVKHLQAALKQQEGGQ